MKVLLLIFILLSIASCNKTMPKTVDVRTEAPSSGKSIAQRMKEVKSEGVKVLNQLSKEILIIQTKNGNIELKFYPNAAPKTVKRISELVSSGFYNGLKFHRVIPNFVAQGGDPDGNGMGGSGQKIPAEFNSIPHELGTLAMARSSDPNSADSQFYICLARLQSLDNKYTVFGKVISGIDIVKKIQPNDKMIKVFFKK